MTAGWIGERELSERRNNAASIGLALSLVGVVFGWAQFQPWSCSNYQFACIVEPAPKPRTVIAEPQPVVRFPASPVQPPPTITGGTGGVYLPTTEAHSEHRVQTSTIAPTTTSGSLPHEPVIVPARFLHQLSENEINAFYPARALWRESEGEAVVLCRVPSDGPVSCIVESETPHGRGFGAATVALAEAMGAAPRTVDEKTVDGTLRLSASFHMPSEGNRRHHLRVVVSEG